MSESVLVALIAAVATIVAAIIGVFAAKAKSGNKTIVKQRSKGKEETIQVGVINLNLNEKKDSKEGKNNE